MINKVVLHIIPKDSCQFPFIVRTVDYHITHKHCICVRIQVFLWIQYKMSFISIANKIVYFSQATFSLNCKKNNNFFAGF